MIIWENDKIYIFWRDNCWNLHYKASKNEYIRVSGIKIMIRNIKNEVTVTWKQW